ncbi:MAG: hypothetical protein ACXV1K_05015, partial [Kineosporiaceae bacterium]
MPLGLERERLIVTPGATLTRRTRRWYAIVRRALLDVCDLRIRCGRLVVTSISGLVCEASSLSDEPDPLPGGPVIDGCPDLGHPREDLVRLEALARLLLERPQRLEGWPPWSA